VSASAKRRSDARAVVASWVRSERMQAMRTRNGSRVLSAIAASAVGFHVGAVVRSFRMTAAMSTACP